LLAVHCNVADEQQHSHDSDKSLDDQEYEENSVTTDSGARPTFKVDDIALAALSSFGSRPLSSLPGGALQLEGLSEGLASPPLVPVRSLNLRAHVADCSPDLSRSGQVRLAILTVDSRPIRRVRGCVHSVSEDHPGG
jgi:hypothetical protein